MFGIKFKKIRALDRLEGVQSKKERGVFRFFAPETPRGTLLTLGIVTLLLGVAGGLYLKWAEPHPEISELHLVRSSAQPQPSLKQVQTEATNAISISAGFLNDLYVLRTQELCYYHLFDQANGNLKIRQRFKISLEEEPTASCFVMNSASPFYGKLFVAFSNKIMIFDPEEKILIPFIHLEEDSRITGITVDSRDLFAADAGQGVILKVDDQMNLVRWGLPDQTTGFAGFQKGRYVFFDLDVDPQKETIYVTHPDQFRIEAFSVLDGHWIAESSFEKRPLASNDSEETFTGAANPASILLLGDGSFLTTDSGPEPDVKSWKSDASFLAKIDEPAVTAPMSADQAPLTSITFTEDRGVRLLILLPTGRLVCMTVPP